MCSHDIIAWKIVRNTVKDRMIDGSLVHKFMPTPRIGRRTKVLNNKIKDGNIAKSYKDYVKIKTDVLRNFNDDMETDDTDSLTDVDYNVISNSKPMLVKYIAKNSKLYYTSEEEEQNRRRKKKSNVKSNKSKESLNVGWQRIIKGNRNTSRLSAFNSRRSAASNGTTCLDRNIVSNRKTLYITQGKSDSVSDSENTVLSVKAKCVDKNGQNHKYSNVNESSSEPHRQNSVTKSINKNKKQTRRHSNLLSPDYKIALPKLYSPNVNNSVLSINVEESNRSQGCNTAGLIGRNDGSSTEAKDHNDILANHQVSKLDNVKRNLTSLLDNVDAVNNEEIQKDKNMECESNHDRLHLPVDLPSDVLVEQQKDSGIDDDSQDKYIKRSNSENSSSIQEISEKMSSSFGESKQIDKVINDVEDYRKKSDLKSYNGILIEQNEGTKFPKDSPQLNTTDNLDTEINDEDKMHFVKLDDSCSVQTQYLQPKITSTEIIHRRYKITSGKIGSYEEDYKDECSPTKIDTLTSLVDNDADDFQEKTMANITEKQEQDTFTLLKETDNEEEEEDTSHMLLEMKKRQANLNLIVDNDSSESENEDRYHMIAETSKGNADSKFKTVNHYSEDEEERSEDGRKSCTSKESTEDVTSKGNADSKSKTVNHCSEDEEERSEDGRKSCTSKESTEDVTALNDIGTEGKLESEKENCVYEEYSIPTSKIINMHENVCADNENKYIKSNQLQDKMNISEVQTVHLDVSCRYRPCNLRELVEDQELLVEKLSASFTLTDLSEDEEAFFLNVPSKVLLCDLRGEKLVLKRKEIKFGKNKYKIKRQKANTVTCIFATNKQQKPYKTVNIKEISTITLQERLLHPSEKSYPLEESYSLSKLDSPLCHNTNTFFNVRKRRIYSDDDFEITDEQTDEMELQRMKLVECQKRRRKK